MSKNPLSTARFIRTETGSPITRRGEHPNVTPEGVLDPCYWRCNRITGERIGDGPSWQVEYEFEHDPNR